MTIKSFAVLVIAFLLLIVPAMAVGAHYWPQHFLPVALNVLSIVGFGLAGVVVVTYERPVVGLTAPTVAQAANCNMVNAVVFMDQTDTSAVVVHNFGISATDLAQLFPVPIVYYRNANTAPVAVSIDISNTNQITITKISANGSQGTFNVIIMRPNTIIT